MEKITKFTDELDGTEYVIIDMGDDQFVSMTKELYDAQQAASKK